MKYLSSTIGLIFNFIVLTTSFKGKIPLGVIFDKDDDHIKSGVTYGIQNYNERAGKYNFTLMATMEDIDIEDSYKLAMSICQQMYGGVFVLLGSRAFKSQNIVRSYTQKFRMPFLTTSIPYDLTGYNGYEIFMKPPVTEALESMIRYLGYKDLHYVYDTEAGAIRMQELEMKLNTTDVKIKMYRLQNISRAYDDLKTLDRIYKDRRDKTILMDFSSESSYSTVLDQIRQLGMNKRGYTYLLGTMNILDMKLDRFTHGGVNITGFQLVDYSSENVEKFITGWKAITDNIWAGAGREHISVDAALAVDAVTIVESTIQKMLQNDSDVFRRTFRRGDVYNNNKTKGIPCNKGIPWMHGETIIRNIKQAGHQGLTGHVKFTKNGLRKGYKLDVYRIGLNYGPHKVGAWRKATGFTLVNHTAGNNNDSLVKGKVYTVTSILEAPFLIRKNPSEITDGKPLVYSKDLYEGFCADLIELIASMCGFNYEIKPNKNGVYGSVVKEAVLDNGVEVESAKWNGMIGELINRTADVAAAPLTITMDREKVIHFSKPFMNSGISIMIKKPEKQKPSVFSFMKPFSVSLWMCIVIGYVVVSVGIFLVSRFSPTEWKKIRIRTRTEFLNKFTLRSSLWFSMGSLMLQGSDTCPRSAAGRIIGGTWWLAVLIVISSYTANLAAFLTIEKLLMPISSADDLANHPDMTYGTLDSGSTQRFFKKSTVNTYVTMWNFMNSDHSMFVKSTQEGVARVRNTKGKYAFLLESVYNEYFNNQEPCDTMQVGPNLNSKGYGIATSKGLSSLRDKISIAVLELFEDGTLIKLKQKWWVDKGTCGVPGAHTESKKKSLSLSNVAGAFYILIGGLVLAIVVGVTHFLRSKSKGRLGGVLVVNSEASRSLLSDYREGQQTENGPNNSDIHRSVPVKGILMNTCKLQAADNTYNHNGRTELYENRCKPYW